MEWLGTLNFNEISPVGLVALFVILLFLGLIVPRWVYRALQTDRDYWRTAYFAEQKQSTIKSEQISQLLVVARTANHVLKSLPVEQKDDHAEAG